MADEAPVTELVARIKFEPDATSFANADKMLDGVAKVMAQLVAAIQQVTVRLDAMAAHAVRAGATVAEAMGAGSIDPRLVPLISKPDAPSLLDKPHGDVPLERLSDVEKAKRAIVAKDARDAAHSQALVDLGRNDFFGPELPPGFKADKANVVKAVGEAAQDAAPKVSLLQRTIPATGVALAASFGLHAIQNFAQGLIHASAAVKDTGERLGLSTRAVQELSFAASQSATNIGALEMGLKLLQQNSAQAARGSKTDAQAFRKLGIDIKDSHGNIKGVDVLLEEAADAIAGLDTPAQQTAAAIQLFGARGAQLLPLLKKGSGGIRELREEAKALGGGLSDETVKAATELDDNLKKLDFVVLGLKSSIGNVLLPVMSTFLEYVSKGVAWVKKLATETKYLETVAIVAFATIAAHSGRAALAVAAQWVKTAAPFIALAGAVAVFALALEDIYQTMTGGKGQIGLWLDEWKGAGTVDNYVRNLAAGVESLKDAVQGLLDLDFSKVRNLFEGMGEPSREDRFEFLSGRVANLKKWGRPQTEIDAAQAELDKFKSQNATLAQQPVIARALGRGLDAGVLQQESGRVSIGSGSANPNATVNNVNVTVNAQTNADPKEIAGLAGKIVGEKLSRQNRNLRAAHASQ